jgi:hypothetical protein
MVSGWSPVEGGEEKGVVVVTGGGVTTSSTVGSIGGIRDLMSANDFPVLSTAVDNWANVLFTHVLGDCRHD